MVKDFLSLSQVYMFKYDSTHGSWKHGEVKADGGKLVIGSMRIAVYHEYERLTSSVSLPAQLRCLTLFVGVQEGPRQHQVGRRRRGLRRGVHRGVHHHREGFGESASWSRAGSPHLVLEGRSSPGFLSDGLLICLK